MQVRAVYGECRRFGVELLTLSGHKLYGPKGIARCRPAWCIGLQNVGGHQERERRAGTENVAVVGFGTAAFRR